MVAATLKLGIAILNGGNSTVQQVTGWLLNFKLLLYLYQIHRWVTSLSNMGYVGWALLSITASEWFQIRAIPEAMGIPGGFFWVVLVSMTHRIFRKLLSICF